MGYDSIRNKALVEFPNGKLMLLCEISDSRTFDCHGRRCWDRTLFHPKGTLFYTKETLKAEQTAYVEKQINNMREFNKLEVERGYATEYIEPTIESYDYNGTRWPGGCRIKNGRAFFGGRPIKAEEYFARWDSPKRFSFGLWQGMKYYPLETIDILNAGLDDYYKELLKEKGDVSIRIH
jgi:hypothetical protein